MGRKRKREQKKTYICNSLDASSFAKRISWLKFEPKVSNFPVIEANLASITLAITVSLFLFSFSILLNVINIKYVEDFYCRWFSKSVRTTKTSQWAFLMTYSDTDPINNRSTAFSPVAPIIIKSI